MNLLLYQNKQDPGLKAYLEGYGYSVVCLDNTQLKQMPTILGGMTFDLLIVEEIPAIDCFKHLVDLGPLNQSTPKILLTANNSETFMINALEFGFNAILHKPISPLVLFTQAKLLANPIYFRPNYSNYTEIYEDLMYNTVRRTIEREGKVLVAFTEGEAAIFKVLLKHLGRKVSKDDLRRLSGRDNNLNSKKSFNVLVTYIRNKLDAAVPILHITRFGQKELMLYLDQPML